MTPTPRQVEAIRARYRSPLLALYDIRGIRDWGKPEDAPRPLVAPKAEPPPEKIP